MPVSTSTCPVTQTALVAVNSAVSGGVTVRLCDEIGSMSSSVTNRISSAKPMAVSAARICLSVKDFFRA